jgi:chaperonin GroES
MSTLSVALRDMVTEYSRLSAGLKPMGDRIIVLRDPSKEQTEGGILIAEVAKEKSFFGTVLAVGDGRFDSGAVVPVPFEPGDRVLFGFHSGTDLPQDIGERLVIMRADEVWCKQ